jgi:hypothetical protein
MSSRLHETFDLPKSEDEFLAELEEKYNFSDNPDLDEVAKLSLTAYKDQMLDIQHIEVKYRSRALEVAQQYLNLAKDAIAKNQDIRLKEEKQNQTKDEGAGSTPQDDDGVVDRNEILLELVKGSKK